MLWPKHRRRAQGVETSKSDDPDTSDAEFVIGRTGEWIRGADTKAGLLFGALVVLLGSMGSSSEKLRGLWSGAMPPTASTIALAICGALLAVAIGLLVAVLIPRRSSPEVTRYSWVWLAKGSAEGLAELGADGRRKEAWSQARQLAKISARKHSLFAGAMWCSVGSVTFFFLGRVV